MFTNYRNLDIFYYLCAQNAQCWTRITKSKIEFKSNSDWYDLVGKTRFLH